MFLVIYFFPDMRFRRSDKYIWKLEYTSVGLGLDYMQEVFVFGKFVASIRIDLSDFVFLSTDQGQIPQD